MPVIINWPAQGTLAWTNMNGMLQWWIERECEEDHDFASVSERRRRRKKSPAVLKGRRHVSDRNWGGFHRTKTTTTPKDSARPGLCYRNLPWKWHPYIIFYRHIQHFLTLPNYLASSPLTRIDNFLRKRGVLSGGMYTSIDGIYDFIWASNFWFIEITTCWNRCRAAQHNCWHYMEAFEWIKAAKCYSKITQKIHKKSTEIQTLFASPRLPKTWIIPRNLTLLLHVVITKKPRPCN